MDFIAEFICEVILEGLFELTVNNPRIKLWIRTVIFVIFTQTLTVLFSIGAVSLYSSGEGYWYIMAVIAAIWGIGMLIGTILCHKKGWPENGI